MSETQEQLKDLLYHYLLTEYDITEAMEQVNTCKIEVYDEVNKYFKITYDNGVSEIVEIKYKPYFTNENTEHL
jgi:hypothetical protein